jgi:hypothetical protein
MLLPGNSVGTSGTDYTPILANAPGALRRPEVTAIRAVDRAVLLFLAGSIRCLRSLSYRVFFGKCSASAVLATMPWFLLECVLYQFGARTR